MKKHKVVIATQFPMDIGRPHGGVEAVSVNLVQGLSQQDDLEVVVVTLNSEIDAPRIDKIGDAAVHRMPKPKASEFVNCAFKGKELLSKYVMELKPDIIHSHDVYGMMVGHLDVPSVFTVHGFIFEDTRVSKRKMAYLRSILWKYIETRGWRRQRNIISISPYVREKLKSYTNARIYDIDNPISARFFENRASNAKVVFFCAAVISPRKNTYTLVKSFERLRDAGIQAELRFAGRIVNDQYGKKVMQKVNDSEHADSITYLGELSSAEIKNEMERASVFVLLSLEENSPMGIEEAMAVGLPVITSNRCGMPYMVKHGESGYLVDPMDTSEVVGRMKQLASENEILERMSDASRAIALERFHPDQVSRKTKNVYLEILQR